MIRSDGADLVTWSIPGPRRTRTGTWADYMAEHYPAYVRLGLYSWDEIYMHLKEKKDAVSL